MIQNKIVARYADGRILKGYTGDFLPTKATFHLMAFEAAPGAKPVEITVAELKALFFVKDLAGNSKQNDLLEFQPGQPAPGRKIRVDFKDGEKLVGTTQGYDPSRAGFFVVPVDPRSNNIRCFVVARAIKGASFL